MPISNMQWRVETGMFNPTRKTSFINEKSLRVVGLPSAFHFSVRFVFVVLLLFSCGDIELNPDPKKRSSYYNLPLEFEQHHCTQFCENRSSRGL